MTKRASSKPGSEKRYVRRDGRDGRIRASDELGRTLSQDRKAQKAATAGGAETRTVARSAATGRYVLMPVPKGSTVSVREARAVARDVIASDKK